MPSDQVQPSRLVYDAAILFGLRCSHPVRFTMRSSCLAYDAAILPGLRPDAAVLLGSRCGYPTRSTVNDARRRR